MKIMQNSVLNSLGSRINGQRITCFLYDQDYDLIVIFQMNSNNLLVHKIKVIDLEAGLLKPLGDNNIINLDISDYVRMANETLILL